MKARALSVALAGLILLAGCGGKANEPFKDAPQAQRNSDPADTIEMPDGFSNVATKCDHGNRIYVLFKGDLAYGSIAVVPRAQECENR